MSGDHYTTTAHKCEINWWINVFVIIRTPRLRNVKTCEDRETNNNGMRCDKVASSMKQPHSINEAAKLHQWSSRTPSMKQPNSFDNHFLFNGATSIRVPALHTDQNKLCNAWADIDSNQQRPPNTVNGASCQSSAEILIFIALGSICMNLPIYILR